FADTEFDYDTKDEDDYVDDELEDKTDLHEDADVFVTKSGGVKSLSRNLADEFEEAGKLEPAHDDIDELNDDLKTSSTMTRGTSQLTTKKGGNRPPINGDTPVANKTLGQCLKAMLDTSSWIQLFAPKAARQAVWAELVEELSHPVNSTSTSQVAENTMSLLMAMGMEAYAYPSSTALADWTASEAGTELQRWKRKLKTAFASNVGIGRQPVARSVGERVNPANIPLPRTPKKTTRAVFGSAEQSPYFHDSHMVTPRSESRKARVAREAEQTESTVNTRPGTGRSSSRH
ncbi:Eukaryotic/viral aspartic protease, partial [Phytophthora megakarya]